MENPTPGVSTPDKSPDQIEREMAQTRESITEKVAALECQVVGTVKTAADTLTGTVDAVKEFVTTAPGAVGETVKKATEAVSETVKKTFDITGLDQIFTICETRDDAIAALDRDEQVR